MRIRGAQQAMAVGVVALWGHDPKSQSPFCLWAAVREGPVPPSDTDEGEAGQ